MTSVRYRVILGIACEVILKLVSVLYDALIGLAFPQCHLDLTVAL